MQQSASLPILGTKLGTMLGIIDGSELGTMDGIIDGARCQVLAKDANEKS